MKSFLVTFYAFRFLAIVFSITFLWFSLYSYINPDFIAIRNNGEIVDTNFLNLLPFIFVGLVSTAVYLWMALNQYRVEVNNEGILVKYWFKKELISWNDVESITQLSVPILGSDYRLKPKEKKRFFFRSDRWHPAHIFFLFSREKTEMEKFISFKKKTLKI